MRFSISDCARAGAARHGAEHVKALRKPCSIRVVSVGGGRSGRRAESVLCVVRKHDSMSLMLEWPVSYIEREILDEMLPGIGVRG